MKKRLVATTLAALIVGGGIGGAAVHELYPKEVVKTEVKTEQVGSLAKQNAMATLWTQSSAEANALRLQAYNVAKERVDEAVKNGIVHKAVVLDIDETVINNMDYMAWAVKNEKKFPDQWSEWIKSAQGEDIAGAVDFIKHAQANGVEVFLVSNRDKSEMEGTLENLKKIGLENIDREHIMLKDKNSSKQERMDIVEINHNVLLYIGDNLADHSDDFYKKNVSERAEALKAHKDEFGTKYIVLPNSAYGDWEGALYGNDYSKDLNKMRMDSLSEMKAR
ncbi:5'-nucleotidase, lipoprotein e(P4) family [Bacillus cereus]|uniref:5'-nucleotidase, lipoprotein e(P4) family n=1 Tax=Bacillus thuringiensis TaxID=1428 RepID=A0AB36VFA5_BACTU|nr:MULTISPECIES: 5'-nucleotidase, lipoprotein e(P4) family [Bacillus cereus group]PDZ55712.1 5'-nucleotidase, lipoprotein e(P4) family [Bacillus cereus]PFO26212.1 5'-nucleotidase, lipoprotein e(P4) family [Bacillus thuringiensis]PFS40332.1 5'-nucleotidase, lipoprotein e(P4) family [Bacillus thuringiensis]PFS58211.1 5'-nucleotidase, lipoprotein e(P4) family [Bacillus thuringiensis]PGZ04951.1 5'-nucleotidase, lipoprotein e(P4) family [Bacillus thuringiensis]